MTLKHFDQEFHSGDIIKHFKYETVSPEDRKRNLYLYELIDLGYDATKEEEVVIYKALYSPFMTYTRELFDFLAEVDHKKYPDIRQKYKFAVVTRRNDVDVISKSTIKYKD